MNYGIPKITLSTWIKNKSKIVEAMKVGHHSKCERLKEGTHTSLGNAVFK